MDGLCFQTKINGYSSKITKNGGMDSYKQKAHVSALGRSGSNTNLVSLETCSSSSSSNSNKFSFTKPLRSFWRKGADRISLGDEPSIVVVVQGDKEEGESDVSAKEVMMMRSEEEEEEKSENWVLKILRIRSLWKEKDGSSNVEEKKEEGEESGECSCCNEEQYEALGVDCDEKEVMQFDRESFSRLLRRVSLREARLYAQMSYLGSLAYNIPKIKPGNLLRYDGLRYVTSSVDKKTQPLEAEKEKTVNQVEVAEEKPKQVKEMMEHHKKSVHSVSASAAYQIAASAASFVQAHTRSILPFRSSKSERKEDSSDGSIGLNGSVEITSSEMASFVATTNSLTAVVSAKEEMKQTVAKDFKSVHSSPCEWFVCDDDESGTRFFAIQGSETLASWQANLLFEPIHFEGLDVLVHRGIYEAAKGIYEQILPEIRSHLKSTGRSATFRFTGHSLGGSLSLLINLMLIIRGEVPLSSLLPVITFGSPTIMCGGDQLLRRLGLPRNHVQSITMHRDIVPRAFSCNYPDRVIDILRTVNRNFRNHPCLKNQKLLYAPLGEILILQPDDQISPHHHLLPSGNGLYVLSCSMSDTNDPEKQLQAAQTVFLNSPHPLEILSDKSSYGSGGTIYRDHDVKAYLRSVRGVIRHELNRIRKAKREHRRSVWWPLIVPQGIHNGIDVGRQVATSNITLSQLSFSGLFRTGGESLKRFSRLVASQHMHLLIVLLFPARLLLVGIHTVFGFH
ncbi:hypothetical protein IFM89_010603 [Coptis chinensis]|uniref:Fungal lipase-type domain-containing protein n=1 Tax=Coptis chinensis TaxID=261450 RepID=A0A835M872_9MAGN|nr:hypothetical protein IFM89_010603 [Coptis chinensis]